VSDNEEMYDKALEAITDLFSDKSVSQEKCKENLRGLIDEIKGMIASL
jgi:hypothetical protein